MHGKKVRAHAFDGDTVFFEKPAQALHMRLGCGIGDYGDPLAPEAAMSAFSVAVTEASSR